MNILQALVSYLREQKGNIVRTERIEDRSGEYDQTYGYPVAGEFDLVDFDALLTAIDDFASQFEEQSKRS